MNPFRYSFRAFCRDAFEIAALGSFIGMILIWSVILTGG